MNTESIILIAVAYVAGIAVGWGATFDTLKSTVIEAKDNLNKALAEINDLKIRETYLQMRETYLQQTLDKANNDFDNLIMQKLDVERALKQNSEIWNDKITELTKQNETLKSENNVLEKKLSLLDSINAEISKSNKYLKRNLGIKLTAKDYKDIQGLRQRDYSYRAIAKKYNCSGETIRVKLAEYEAKQKDKQMTKKVSEIFNDLGSSITKVF